MKKWILTIRACPLQRFECCTSCSPSGCHRWRISKEYGEVRTSQAVARGAIVRHENVLSPIEEVPVFKAEQVGLEPSEARPVTPLNVYDFDWSEGCVDKPDLEKLFTIVVKYNQGSC